METDVGWAVHEPAGSLAVDGVVWVIRAFVLPLFFLLSGFLAARVVARGSVAALVRRRLVRLAVPLAVFVVPVSVAMNALWDWGKSMTAGRAIATSGVPELRASEAAVTLGHLWFLYYLLIVTAVAAAVVVAARRAGVGRPRIGGLGVPLVAAIGASGALWWGGKLQLDTPLGFGIDAPIAGYHGVFFAWGWLSRAGDLLRYGARAPLWLALAAGLFVALLPALVEGASPGWAYAASGAFSCAMVAGVLGACVRWCPRPPGWIRLASGASYWTYVIHLPFLVLAQVALYQAALPAALEVAAALAATLAVCLSSYRYLVRDTWVARFVA